MTQHIVISSVGRDRPGIVHDLTRAVLDCGGNIVDSRMATLGNEFAMLLLIAGNWHTIAKLRTALDGDPVSKELDLTIHPTELRAPRDDLVPYAVDVVCLDQAGIVHHLSGFFAAREIEIAEMSTRSYAAPHTGAPMFTVQMVVNIPGRVHIAAVREEFMDFCDQLNLDAIIEPVKN